MVATLIIGVQMIGAKFLGHFKVDPSIRPAVTRDDRVTDLGDLISGVFHHVSLPLQLIENPTDARTPLRLSHTTG